MSIEEFDVMLKKASLSKKEFARLTGLNYNSVTNWSGTRRVPTWVDSWMENYIKVKAVEGAARMLVEANL